MTEPLGALKKMQPRLDNKSGPSFRSVNVGMITGFLSVKASMYYDQK